MVGDYTVLHNTHWYRPPFPLVSYCQENCALLLQHNQSFVLLISGENTAEEKKTFTSHSKEATRNETMGIQMVVECKKKKIGLGWRGGTTSEIIGTVENYERNKTEHPIEQVSYY